MYHGTSWKIAGSRPHEGNELFSIYLILPAALGLGVYSATNRNEYQKKKKMLLRSRARPVRRTDKPTAITEPTVWTVWDPQHLITLQAFTACYEDR
jgi:hypothetical protein